MIAGILTDRDDLPIVSDEMNAVDIIELRVDMFGNAEPGHVKNVFKEIRTKYNKPILATVRDVREGGEKEIPDRLDLYRGVIPLADLVDVEIASAELFPQVRTLCSTFKKILIGSYHNFDATPDNGFLDGIVRQGKDLGADIVKIAVKATCKDDLIGFLHFALRNRDKGLITISMGNHGLPSRIFTPLFGSPITYGFIRTASAPGQLSVQETLSIFRKLKMR
ncbi:MAG TPA: type I 3-dehydroquinate dehydratase [Dissulfurispiraceae bacterium]|nr:type I 3-dehydroquinate dehydratase [Dissulfurispiraceae bacterium]